MRDVCIVLDGLSALSTDNSGEHAAHVFEATVTVEELLEELKLMPATAPIEVQIRKNVMMTGEGLDDLYEFRPAGIETVVYSLGRAVIQLDE